MGRMSNALNYIQNRRNDMFKSTWSGETITYWKDTASLLYTSLECIPGNCEMMVRGQREAKP